VAIARALVNRPAVLLADEPTGNLDPESSDDVLRLLFEINNGGTAVLMATHDHEMVRNFGRRVIHLRDGKLHEDRTTGIVGNLSERLETIQLERERERLKRLEAELERHR
jgi:cell division transport system ATP-binding protein